MPRLISTLDGSTVAAYFRSQSPLEYEFATDNPPRPDTPLNEQCQLAAEEEILGVDRLGRAEQEHHPPEGVLDQDDLRSWRG